ncbi:MAG: hypothetical protein WBL67_04760 [Nitrososphaeraceae archaeon]|jgi:hypothetical protein
MTSDTSETSDDVTFTNEHLKVTDESEVGTKASVTDLICERLALLLFRIYRTITACKMKD